jgi:hypothetical protein
MFTIAETVGGRCPDRIELAQTTKMTLRHLMLLGRRRRELVFHFKFGEGAVCYRVDHRSLFVSSHRHILANIAECGGISVLMILVSDSHPWTARVDMLHHRKDKQHRPLIPLH